MFNKIQTSSGKIKRSSRVAFWLSLIFPGAGLFYVSKILIAFAIVFLEFIILTLPVLNLISYPEKNSVLFFSISVALFGMVHIFSIVYAIRGTLDSIRLNKYNSAVFSLIFSIFSLFVISFSFVILFSYYQINIISDNLMNPNLKDGDICLSSRVLFSDCREGDIVYSGERFLRLISKEKGLFEIKSGYVFINGQKLKLDVPEHDDSERFPQFIYYEVNKNIKYKIYIDIDSEKTLSIFFRINLTPESAVLLNDNRKIYYPVIKRYDYFFRLEKVLFSPDTFSFFKNTSIERKKESR